METELKSHSFQNRTLGSYGVLRGLYTTGEVNMPPGVTVATSTMHYVLCPDGHTPV